MGNHPPLLKLSKTEPRVEVGGTVVVRCALTPWPGPTRDVATIELELGYDTKLLGVSSQLKTAGLVVRETKKPLEEKYTTTVGVVSVPVGQLDKAGVCEASLDVPSDAPPSVIGFRTSDWKVRGRLVYSHGHDKWSLQHGFHRTVDAPVHVDTPSAGWPIGKSPPWMLEDTDDKDVSVELETSTASRGGELRGRLVLAPDPMEFAARQSYITKRGKQKALRQAQLASIAVEDISVTLECWRWTQSGTAGHRMWSTAASVAPPRAPLAIGTAHAIPFQIDVPTRAPLSVDQRTEVEGELPPTWYGDEHYRWLLRVEASTSAKQVGAQYSGQRGPLRMATEVIIT